MSNHLNGTKLVRVNSKLIVTSSYAIRLVLVAWLLCSPTASADDAAPSQPPSPEKRSSTKETDIYKEAPEPDTRVVVCWPMAPLAYDPEKPAWVPAAEQKTLKKADVVYQRTDGVNTFKSKAPGPGYCKPLSVLAQQSGKVRVYSEDMLVIRVFKDKNPVKMSDLDSLVVTASVYGAEDTTARVIHSDFNSAKSAELTYTMIRVGTDLLDADPGDRISITVKATIKGDEAATPPIEESVIETTRYLDLRTRLIGYGQRQTKEASSFRRSRFGFWAPVGIMGGYFKNVDDRGMTFSGTPIAIACGTKWYHGPSYVGLSLMLGYTLFQGDKEEKTTDETTMEEKTEETQPFSVTGITPGLLIDINEKFLVGVGYTWDLRRIDKDLRDTYKNPGVAVMVGLPIGIGQ